MRLRLRFDRLIASTLSETHERDHGYEDGKEGLAVVEGGTGDRYAGYDGDPPGDRSGLLRGEDLEGMLQHMPAVERKNRDPVEESPYETCPHEAFEEDECKVRETVERSGPAQPDNTESGGDTNRRPCCRDDELPSGTDPARCSPRCVSTEGEEGDRHWRSSEGSRRERVSGFVEEDGDENRSGPRRDLPSRVHTESENGNEQE